MKKRSTLKDVAKEAGVSIATVSAVVNNRDNGNIRIGEETRERVWHAVDRLQYRPNMSARQMRTKKSTTIGFITDEISTTPYAVDIIRGAEDEAWQHDYMMLIANTGGDLEREKRLIEMMLARGVDGLIYATWIHSKVPVPRIPERVPTVLVNCSDVESHFPSIIPDEVQGAYEPVDWLIQQGHQRIGFINLWSTQRPPTIGRRAGYIKAHEDHKLTIDEDLIGPGPVENTTLFDVGYNETKRLMTLSDPPTAIFCANDRIVMGVYEALKEMSVAIPGDVAVIGFDNQVDIAANLRPSLTTMALPFLDMGQEAIRFLLNRMASGDSTAPQMTIQCRLIERESHQ